MREIFSKSVQLCSAFINFSKLITFKVREREKAALHITFFSNHKASDKLPRMRKIEDFLDTDGRVFQKPNWLRPEIFRAGAKVLTPC